MNEEEKQIFGGRKTNKFILILSFIVLIISIVLLLAGKWLVGIGGIVLHIIIAYISYRLSGGKHNKIIWKEMDLFELIKKTYQSGEMKIGFHTMRDQKQLLEKLKIDGLITSFPGNVRKFLRDGFTTKREVFVALQDFIIIESVHDGREWFWDGYGKIVSRKFFRTAEIMINIDSSVISRFFHVLKGIMSENNDVSLKMKEGALRITWQRTLPNNEREIEHHYASDVGSVINKSNELAELDHKKSIAKSGMTVLEILKNGHWVEWRSDKGLDFQQFIQEIRSEMFTKTENNSSEDGIKLDEKLEKTFGKSIKYCPYCGKTDIRENEICFECGRYLHEVRCESKYKCTKCSCNVPKDALYCWNCGERFAEDEVSFKKGMSLWENGKFREAIFYFDKAIKRNPKDARAWYVKAVAFENLGKLEEAIECFDTAIKINPDDLLEEWVEELRVFWNNKGTMLAELQHYETAIYCFEKALEIDSQFVDAWYNKGFVFSKLNNFDEAVRCYDEALAIDSQHTRAWLNKGTAFYRLKSYEDAIRCFDRTIALDPSYVEAWYNKGVALKRLGLVEEAQKCFEKVQDLRSG